MNEDKRTRKFQLTINNPFDHGFNHEKIKELLLKFQSCIYWCMCDETGSEGTYHTHIYVHLNNASKFSTIKSRFPCAHIEFSRGTAQQNRDYIRKEGKYENSDKKETNHPETFEEWGVLPLERGYKKDDEMSDLFDMIKSGMTLYQIIEQEPRYLMQTDKLERAMLLIHSEQNKETWRDLEVEYIWGPTGTGKTRYVMETYGYSKVYRVTDYDHPFDSYKGQDIILFEEFRSSLRIEDMLKYLDGYPVELPARYNNKNVTFTKVYIATNIDLRSQYLGVQDSQPMTWDAFLRRIHTVRVFYDKGISKVLPTQQYLEDYFPCFNSPFESTFSTTDQIFKQEELTL